MEGLGRGPGLGLGFGLGLGLVPARLVEVLRPLHGENGVDLLGEEVARCNRAKRGAFLMKDERNKRSEPNEYEYEYELSGII